jgi:hypothetical protein
MRVLVTITPRMYRETVASSLQRSRPHFEVKIVPLQDGEEEVRGFGLHLLVRNDTDGLDPRVLAGVPCWVEVLYSDSMDAKICMDERAEEMRDISTEELLRVADEAATLKRLL